MKALKRNLLVAIGELLVFVMLFASATYAFLYVATSIKIEDMDLQIQTVGQLLIRNMQDPLDEFSKQITFNLDEENEGIYDEVTTVNGIDFFYEFYNQEVLFEEGFFVRDFAFISNVDMNVYLDSIGDEIFTTTSTGGEADVVNALRIGFVPFTYDGDIKVYEEPPISIYSRLREQTFVYQDPNYQEDQKEIEEEMVDGIYVDNFTTLGKEGGHILFSVEANVERYVRLLIWVEGNDPDSIAKIAQADFSVNIQFVGEHIW